MKNLIIKAIGSTLVLFFTSMTVPSLALAQSDGECRSPSEEVMFSWPANSPLGWKVSYKDARDANFKGKNLRLICVVKDAKTKMYVSVLFVAEAGKNGIGDLSDTKKIIKDSGSVYGFNQKPKWELFSTRVESFSTLELKEGFSVEKYCIKVAVKNKFDVSWADFQYVAVAFINDNNNPNRRYLLRVSPNTRISGAANQREKTCEVIDGFLKTFRRQP